ncbi:phosphoethanolamine--lipid A transferase EptA [Cognatilysobacter lacus]|uniref:Phosphoethanolamine--lipid A transferase EptA n=1 Tax=Cognatilysobacter lacus TaxID=1643323 RepID=A0A5D8Z572_9GAMM|nr:phosphoethanolamine--lipid A transferase EptA [Lysobacter lacus]TZF90145.1 phosphoethanolamine--lipid A transferase EptA [Lysobacter lacus]
MNRLLRLCSVTCRYPTFVGAFALANIVLFGVPLYSFALANSPADLWPKSGVLVLLTGVQVVVTVLALTSVSLLSIRATKVVCIALLVGNSTALYFMNTYNVLLDKSMMGNVLGTDRQEATELLHPQILLYVLLLGALPACLVAMARIVDSSRLRRLRLLAITAVTGCVMVYAGSTSWLWFDKNAKTLGGLMLPWSYVANTGRFLQERADANRPQALLPPLRFSVEPRLKTIVVLVIGESARAQNHSLYGYGRSTDAELAGTDVIALPGARACATYTTAAIRCMLSHLGSDAPGRVTEEILPNYLQRHGVEVIWRSNNWGEPPLKVGVRQRLEDIRKACTGAACGDLEHDEGLLHGLQEVLARSPSQRIFVVLHLAGSHGPTYYRKYPAAFTRFAPVCQSVELSTCSHQSLVNAYDNTIVYTDHVLAETVKVLAAVPASSSSMIYISDHGESLGERGFYLHGAPNSIAPDVQRAIPFMVWMSPSFKQSNRVSAADLRAKGDFGDANIFHSVLGAFAARSAVYDPHLDLFSHSR